MLILQAMYNHSMAKLRTLKEWSAAVKARDGKCMCCGATTALVAHHVKPKSQYPELKFDLNNGQTLCVDCHKEHHKENPVSGLGKGVVSKVWLKQRVKELEREVAWLRESQKRALDIIAKDNAMEKENTSLRLANQKLRLLLNEKKGLYPRRM